MRNAVLTTIVTVAVVICPAMADWPQFLGPMRNGVAPPAKEKLAPQWPEGGPPLRWSGKLGPGFGGPAIRDGKVYVLDRLGKDKDVLRCLDLASGTQEWSHPYDAPGKKLQYEGSRSTPAVDDKYVFTIGPFGHFRCVDKVSRQSLWSKNLLADFQGKLPNWGVAISPLLYKDQVIVAALGKTAGVVAYEKATGKQLWRSRPLGRMAYVSPIVMRVGGADQLIVVTDGGFRVAGLDAASGAVLWVYREWKCSIPIAAPTDCGDGRLFLTGGYDAGSVMIKIDKQGGKFVPVEVFRHEKIGSILHNALVYKDHLYVNANTKKTHDGLLCMDLEGNIKWQTRQQPNSEKGSLILADGVIFIMDGKKGILRMARADPAGYVELGEVKVLAREPIWAPMAVSGGKLVCRDQGEMKCLDVSAGQNASAAAGS
jgi:outer membrane protein assembly factor BamB